MRRNWVFLSRPPFSPSRASFQQNYFRFHDALSSLTGSLSTYRENYIIMPLRWFIHFQWFSLLLPDDFRVLSEFIFCKLNFPTTIRVLSRRNYHDPSKVMFWYRIWRSFSCLTLFNHELTRMKPRESNSNKVSLKLDSCCAEIGVVFSVFCHLSWILKINNPLKTYKRFFLYYPVNHGKSALNRFKGVCLWLRWIWKVSIWCILGFFNFISP